MNDRIKYQDHLTSAGVAAGITGNGPLATHAVTDDAAAAIEQLAPPIQAAGTLTKTQVVFLIGQVVAALAGVIGFLGLGETTWIVKLVRFLQSNDAVPLISVFAWLTVAIVLWFRNRRRAIERAVMASLLPGNVAEVKGVPAPAVKAAIETVVAQATKGKGTGL